MRSTPCSDASVERSSGLPARASRAPRLGLSLVALALAAACGQAEAPVAEGDLHEVTGNVQAWPGEAQASCGSRLVVTRFSDDVGARAGTETRTLITTPEAYQAYFGHAAPAGVDLGREWVIFYAPGARASGGYSADVSVVGVNGDVLHAVTTLTSPIPPCAPPVPGTDVGSGSSGSGSAGGVGGTTGTGGANAGSSGSAPSPVAGPTTPVTSGPNTPGSTPAAPPAILVPPTPPDATTTPPDGKRPFSPYVLVKFLAQKTHSVEFQHQDINPGCGGPVPPASCAAILCPTGQTCIELESYPPRGQCVVIDPPPPPPTRCTSSMSCPSGTRCSTERGECLGCGGGPGTVCPAICFGVCEPSAPNGVCSGGELKGDCRSEAELKAAAAKICEASKLELVDFAVGNACFASGFATAKYSCCNGKPTPPPVAVCKVDSDCELTSSACGKDACTCSAEAKNLPRPLCAVPAVACLVDPCAKLQAACVSGQCVAQGAPKR